MRYSTLRSLVGPLSEPVLPLVRKLSKGSRMRYRSRISHSLLICLLASELLCTTIASAHDARQTGDWSTSAVECFVDTVIGQQLETRKIAGAVVAIVKDGRVILCKGYGFADVAARRSMTSETIVELASVSKTITALAAMQLVETGKLDLDRDVNSYLDFTVPPAAGSVPITLRRLLSHRSRFEDRQGNIAAWWGERLPLGPYLLHHMPPQLPQSEDLIAYSNYNAALAAYVIERVSGQWFETYLREHVFEPLQMTRSTAVQPLPKNFAPWASTGYLRSDLPPTQASKASETVFEVGSAKIRSSGSDMGRLMLAFLNPDDKIISGASLKTMMEEEVITPRGFMGLGLYSPVADGGNPFIGHDGGTGGFGNVLAFLPEQQFGLFLSYNSLGVQSALTPQAEFLRRITEKYFSGSTLKSTNIVTDSASVYQPTRRVESNLFRLHGLLQQVYVRPVPGGRLLFSRPAFIPGGLLLTEAKPGLFRDESGRTGLEISFQRLQDSTLMQIGAAYNVFLAVPWWSSARFVVPTILISIIVAIPAILLWPLTILRFRRKGVEATELRWVSLTRFALLCNILGIGAAFWLVLPGRPLVATASSVVTPVVIVIYVLAWMAVFLTIPALWHAVQFNRHHVKSWRMCCRQFILAMALLALSAFSLYFRIAGTSLAL